MVKLTVVGSISTDFIIETDKRPKTGETVEGKNFSTAFGGKGANQAVAAARLKADVYMIGTVGNDTFADELLTNLEGNSIFIDGVERVTHLPSGSAFITIQDGDNAIIYIPGANNALTPKRIVSSQEELKKSDLVIVQNEVPVEAIEALVRVCDELDTPVLYNPAPARKLSKEAIEKVRFITPNETEFSVLFPGEKMEEVLAHYPNKLLVTAGSEGVYYHDGREVKLVPANKVTPVDTTGAGDTFNGAFAVAWSNGLTIEDSIRFGNLAASLSIQKMGAQSGIPTLEEMKGSTLYEKEWHIE
ncbi:ribokinase [Alkalibacterium subtropicum]|uniref:Ribokinase n=1 Tax=Alkalibacterium subtropicum TaxID=753702 RepID=A0A1I1HS49_9LACT|nr:ribokinase [Alkalibacterium subtropicum]SFC26917.1 ribokinase [Alkalibacterium subtropicum]